MRIIAFSLLFSWVLAGVGHACSCVWPDDMTLEQHLEKTDVVFLGVFKSEKEKQIDGWIVSGRKGQFDVIEVLKGKIGDSVAVYYAEDNGANCSAAFRENEQYEVFGHIVQGGQIVTSECDGTRRAMSRNLWSWEEYRKAAKKK